MCVENKCTKAIVILALLVLPFVIIGFIIFSNINKVLGWAKCDKKLTIRKELALVLTTFLVLVIWTNLSLSYYAWFYGTSSIVTANRGVP